MKWNGDLGLELYVAKEEYGDRQQYLDSQSALRFIDEYGLRNKIQIIPLERLNGHREFFTTVKDPTKKIRLPFLVCAHGCETGAVHGYSGLEAIIEILDSVFQANQKTS